MFWSRTKPKYNRIGRKMTTVKARVRKAKFLKYWGYAMIVINLTLIVVLGGMIWYYTAQAIMMLFLLFLFGMFFAAK